MRDSCCPIRRICRKKTRSTCAKKGYSQHKPPLPLYTVAESQAALEQFREIPRTGSFHDQPAIFRHAARCGAHSWLVLARADDHRKRKANLVVFSGDIGRYDQPILKDPEPPSRADYLLCETTYGDRDHPAGSVADELASVINDTVKRGGVIVIPAFAVDRTQMLMYYLRELVNQKRIPVLPVYVDSPMAINVTDIIRAPSRRSRFRLHK